MNFLRCGMEKLTAGYERQAATEVLVRLDEDVEAPFRAPLESSSLRFFAAGAATDADGDALLRM